ncbi:hypothetical protein XELAEV_18012277mg [Xenopus laevis]|uniref:Uncharacterized protein n=1 Tax=Xenopus laevis TaxID=8355 RepID=A0A974DPM8_XENLA|nr:hypothetical protein XELAEV_18012277mg [Xenopus laevis]
MARKRMGLKAANGKTYEKGNRKFGKQQDSDANSTSLSHTSAPLRSSLSDDYSLIAAEVARLINPVIESTISKAIDKLQIKITSILEKLSTHDKRFGEIEDVVSQLQDDMIDSSSRLNSLENQNRELKLKLDDLENRPRRNNLRFINIPESFQNDSLNTFISKTIPLKLPQECQSFRIERLHRIDYSLFLSQKRKEFSKTCQSLANLHFIFSLMYPAKLKIFLPSGARIFSDSGEAHTFTSHLEKKNSGNLASVTTSNSNGGSPPKDQRWKRYDIPRQSKFSNDLKPSQVQTKSRSRSRSALPPRTGSLPHSSEEDMIPDT